MASVPIQNSPRLLTMQDFRAINSKYQGLAKSCRFVSAIRPVGKWLQPYSTFTQDLIYLCEIAEMPGRGFMNIDVRYYGPSHKLPFQTTYEDLNMTFLCRTKSLERQFFDDWMLIINPINSFDFNYRDDYRAEIDIYQYGEVALNKGDRAPEPQYVITAHNVYPILVNAQPMTWMDDQFQRLVVAFTYTHWSRRNLDPVPRSSAGNGGSFDLVEGRTNIGYNYRF